MNALVRTLLTALVLALSASHGAAQQRLFAIVDYMHVPDSSSEKEYIALEKLWQQIHQRSVDAGNCLSWAVYRVENGGRNQFVTVQVYDSPAKFMDPWGEPLEKLFKNLYTDAERAIMDKTDAIRVLTRHELWEVEATAMAGGREPAGYNVVNFMKTTPGKVDAYYLAEKQVFQKGHQVRVDNGDMRAWFFLGRSFPAGSDAEYDFITVDAYADKAAADKPIDMKKIEAALSKEDLAKAEKIEETRTVVRREVWYPVLRTSRPNR